MFNINITVNNYFQAGNVVEKTINTEYADEILVDVVNKKPQPWREKKMQSIKLADSFNRQEQYGKAGRVRDCGSYLVFNKDKRLKHANFCRERLCPMCMWRKSRKTFHQLSNVMDVAQEENNSLETVFLTLTARNCSGEELPEMINRLITGWRNVNDHRRIRNIAVGWFRALEVTYNAKTKTYHPHLHVIFMVDKQYFYNEKMYLHTADWVHIWRTSCKFDYDPICDIRAVKTNKTRDRKHLAEVSKYTVKDTDVIRKSEEETDTVVSVLSEALFRKRLFAYGGNLKLIYKRLNLKDPEKDGDLVNLDDNATIRDDVAEVLTTYRWDFGLHNYYKQK